jgi:GNAT superfamily N-acetyltransferase
MNIRKGTEADFEAVLEMIKELALFEKAPEAVINSVESMREEKKYFDFFVAEMEGEIVGMALYFFAYYTWVGKSLYLDDLYVKPAFRGQNIGKALLEKVIEVAKDEQCKRMRWQVLDWNTPAIEFYKKMNAMLSQEWINCNLHF